MNNSIVRQILQKMQFAPTLGQLRAIEIFVEYLTDPDPYSLFLLHGYAGTGKTYLLRAITEAVLELGMQLELMATTGRAAKVLSATTNRTASTIHRVIYRGTAAGVEEGGSYKIGVHAYASTLFVVDEASMIPSRSAEPTPFGSGDLLSDLLQYIWSADGCRLIIVGDTAQLPPVGSTISDALNVDLLRERYGMRVYEAELSDVVRQEAKSGILRQATYLRDLLAEYPDAQEGIPLPIKFTLGDDVDLSVITGVDLVDAIDVAYRTYGRDQVLIVAPSNKRALIFNQGIRAQVLDYDELIVRGEQLIVARNNYHWAKRKDRADFIANGEMIEIQRIHGRHTVYGLEYADATIYLPERDEELDVRLLLTGLTDEQAQRTHQQRLDLYNTLVLDYEHQGISGTLALRQAIRGDDYWGALEVKYGYAVTGHKAQGGQWACVFIDLGLMALLPTDRSMVRWLYTALTRATERVYLVNPPKDLIGGIDS